MDTRMTKSERDAFLAAPRVGVFSFNEAGEAPISAPMWYRYEAGTGEYWFATPKKSRKARFLEVGSPVTVAVQEEFSPQRYVVARGRVSRIEPTTPDDLKSLDEHYREKTSERERDPAAAEAWVNVSVTVHVRIDSWLSADLGNA